MVTIGITRIRSYYKGYRVFRVKHPQGLLTPHAVHAIRRANTEKVLENTARLNTP